METKILEKGSTTELMIEDMSDEGQGIARKDGLVVFVSGCVAGDRVLAKINKVKKRYALGSCLEILEPSPARIGGEDSLEETGEELCPYGRECGGCPYGRIRYGEELRLKQTHVQEKLARLGGVRFASLENRSEAAPEAETVFEPITAMEIPYRYRNKAQMQVSTGGNIMRKGGIIENLGPAAVGFYAPGSHNVVDCSDCLLQSEAAVAAAEALRTFMEEDHITAWDEKWEQGLMRHMVVRTAFGTGEVMVILVINGKAIPNAPKLIDMLDKAILESGYSLESIYININKDNNSRIFGREFVPLAGKRVIREEMGELTFEISPASFYQVNPAMTVALYDKVKEYASRSRSEETSVILDLYCGVGSIGLWLAEENTKVVGIESVKEAVVDANRNAVINGIVDARYVCGKAETILPAVLFFRDGDSLSSLEDKGLSKENLLGLDEEVISQIQRADTVILDPPRKGCHPALLDAVLTLAPERIVYVSCDPATLARDIAYLSGNAREEGEDSCVYRVEKVAPFDMFPRTGHVECVVLMSKVKD